MTDATQLQERVTKLAQIRTDRGASLQEQETARAKIGEAVQSLVRSGLTPTYGKTPKAQPSLATFEGRTAQEWRNIAYEATRQLGNANEEVRRLTVKEKTPSLWWIAVGFVISGGLVNLVLHFLIWLL